MHKRTESLSPPKSLPLIYSVRESGLFQIQNRTELLSTLLYSVSKFRDRGDCSFRRPKRLFIIMCCLMASSFDNSSSPGSPSSRRRAKGAKVRVRILRRAWREEEKGTEMELQNLKLYLENRLMIEENERLRRKALVLTEENRALLTELRKKLPNVHDD